VDGVIGDRLPRKRVLIGSDLLRLGAQSLTAWLLVTGSARIWELIVLAFMYGGGEAMFRPASTGFAPETVSRARLQQANALLATTTSTWTVVGPIAAGVMGNDRAWLGDRRRCADVSHQRRIRRPYPIRSSSRSTGHDVLP
jgi:MFS family permease